MQDIFVYDRARIKVTGVDEIAFFTENEIILETGKGGLVVFGNDMKIGGFDSGKREVEIRGLFHGCEYVNDGGHGGYGEKRGMNRGVKRSAKHGAKRDAKRGIKQVVKKGTKFGLKQSTN